MYVQFEINPLSESNIDICEIPWNSMIGICDVKNTTKVFSVIIQPCSSDAQEEMEKILQSVY